MKTVLVTGINGFVGHHLASELASQGNRVIGTGMDAQLLADIKPYATEYFGNCDLTDPNAVAKLPLERVDGVINLAGLAQVGASYGQEEKYKEINVGVHTTLINRFEELGKLSTRVVAVSTGAVYDSNQPMPLTEDSRLHTDGSPYAMSKIAMEKAMAPYQKNGANIIIARPLNHIGPGQQGGFLVPDLIAQISTGGSVTVGSLKTKRDYTDVRDVVKAYVLLATQEKLAHNLYNICSGKSVPGETILKTIAKLYNKPNIKVHVDQSRMRPNDPQELYGSYKLLSKDTDWQPNISLEQTLKDIVVELS